jgi:hypothetical protein
MKRLVIFTVVVLSIASWVGTANAAGSERQKAKVACAIAAVTWDGNPTAGGVVPHTVVSTGVFPDLTVANDKTLRKVVRQVVQNPESIVAVHALGKWCKKHFGTIPQVKNSPFEVNPLAAKSA